MTQVRSIENQDVVSSADTTRPFDALKITWHDDAEVIVFKDIPDTTEDAMAISNRLAAKMTQITSSSWDLLCPLSPNEALAPWFSSLIELGESCGLKLKHAAIDPSNRIVEISLLFSGGFRIVSSFERPLSEVWGAFYSAFNLPGMVVLSLSEIPSQAQHWMALRIADTAFKISADGTGAYVYPFPAQSVQLDDARVFPYYAAMSEAARSEVCSHQDIAKISDVLYVGTNVNNDRTGRG